MRGEEEADLPSIHDQATINKLKAQVQAGSDAETLLGLFRNTEPKQVLRGSIVDQSELHSELMSEGHSDRRTNKAIHRLFGTKKAFWLVLF